MAQTATRSTRERATSKNPAEGKSSTSVKSMKSAVRGLVGSKGEAPKPAGRRKTKEVPKAAVAEIKRLRAKGYMMSTVHKMMMDKYPDLTYNDVWKVEHTA